MTDAQEAFYAWLEAQYSVCAFEAAAHARTVLPVSDDWPAIDWQTMAAILTQAGYVRVCDGRSDQTFANKQHTMQVKGRTVLRRQAPLPEEQLKAYVRDMGARRAPDAEGLWLWLHVADPVNVSDRVTARWAFYPTRDGQPSPHLFFFWPDSRKGMHRAEAASPSDFRTQSGVWLCAPAPHTVSVSDAEIAAFEEAGIDRALQALEPVQQRWSAHACSTCVKQAVAAIKAARDGA